MPERLGGPDLPGAARVLAHASLRWRRTGSALTLIADEVPSEEEHARWPSAPSLP